MITLERIHKTYSSTFTAVHYLSLELKPGEIFGFLGPNGAGKTTTIKMITGILEPDEGTIRINGKDIQNEALEAKKQFGYVPDSPDMFLRLKGMEYLNFMGDLYEVPKQKRMEKIEELAKRFNLYGNLTQTIQSYSHGMRQKMMIMGALLHDPAVWILDEPLTGLDPKSSYVLKEMMREHADSGKTVFFSTHVLEVAEKLCDRVGIINRGRLVFSGTLQEMQGIQNHSSLEQLFLEMTQ